MKPLVLVNFKTYPEVSGKKALQLAKKISQVNTKRYGLVLAPPLLHLKEIAKNLKSKLKIVAQHVDDKEYGPHTGAILPAEVKKIGGWGALINHSEHPLPLKIIKKTIEACKANQLTTIVCATTLKKIKKIARWEPEYIAYEPAALIGGDVSVTTAKPKIVMKAVQLAKKISPKTKLLCGAGVHSPADLKRALELGADGVLIAHGVVQAKNPKRVLEEMLQP